MTAPRRTPDRPYEQPMQLMWAPRTYGSFDDADLVRWRLLLNDRGWCTGLVWNSYATSAQPSRTGFTWNTTSKVRDSIHTYVTGCAHEGVGASACFDAVVAETRDAHWTREFAAFGSDLDRARAWMQGFSSDESWARGAVLPPLTIHWSWADPAEFTFYVATKPDSEDSVLLATGPKVLIRRECSWLVVPPSDASIAGSTLLEVRAGLHELVDKYGAELLTQPAILSAFGVSSAVQLENRVSDLIPDDGSWLLIDTTDGWTLDAGSARLVPALDGADADLMLAPESTSERTTYARRAGVPLSFPEAAGTPLDELGGGFWLIGGENGDFIENLKDVVLVRATGDGEFDNTGTGCDAAIQYVRDRRTASAMPVLARQPLAAMVDRGSADLL